jgi:hypothetical protein
MLRNNPKHIKDQSNPEIIDAIPMDIFALATPLD